MWTIPNPIHGPPQRTRPGAPHADTCEGTSPCGENRPESSRKDVGMAVMPVSPDRVASLWEQVLQKLRERLTSDQAFETWFRPIVAREIGPGAVDLEVPNAFFV